MDADSPEALAQLPPDVVPLAGARDVLRLRGQQLPGELPVSLCAGHLVDHDDEGAVPGRGAEGVVR